MTSPEEESPEAAVSVTRRREGRALGGVCAGLPEPWGLQTDGLRLVFAAATLCGGVGVVVYLACWLIIPADEADPDADTTRGVVLFVGAVGGVAATVLLAAAGAVATALGLGWIVFAFVCASLIVFALFRSRVSPVATLLGVAAIALPSAAVALSPARIALQSGASVSHRATLPLWALLLATACDCGGFVLVADAVRIHIGLARPPRSLWRSLTGTPSRGGRIAVRAVPGVALVGVATVLGITLLSRYAARHPVPAMLGMLGIGGLAALLLATPVLAGLCLRLDLDKATRAREEERRRYAAHLHDSVLQTLALVQRQAGDPDTVARLARRQEGALRAWMAGEAELSGATVATAVRSMVSEVEDDHGLRLELTAIGDGRLDARGKELIAAAREALRNAATHAPNAPVNVFLDVRADATEMFIRDDGPGFDLTTVPAERRGLRDSMIARMRFVGGSATVDSAPGEGTEITLRLPHEARTR